MLVVISLCVCVCVPAVMMQLLDRFHARSSDIQAAKAMKDLVVDAANKYTTIIYDGIQKLQNNIHSESFQ